MEKNKDEIVDISFLTEDQQYSVLENGHEIVSAAAGSGKTTTMMKKVTYLISKGESLNDMIILVYNNAAAEELMLKAHTVLLDASCKAEGELKERFRNEIDNLPFARISTIHSFCNSMLRENFEKLGLSPTFEILDESATEQYYQKALDKVFEEYSLKDDKEFEELLLEFSTRRNEDDLKNEIKQLFLKYDIQPNGEEFIKNVEECYSDLKSSKFLEVLVGDSDYVLNNIRDELLEYKEILQDTTQKKYVEKIDIILEFLDRALYQKSYYDRLMILCGGYESITARRTTNDEYLIEVIEKLKNVIGYLNDYIKFFVELDINSPIIKLAFEQNKRKVMKMIEIMLKFKEEFERLKSKKDMLTYSDLEHKMVDLIKLSGDDFKKFKYVFVDEYQDVNPTQEYIISSLVGDNCYFVGDVKQSIYGFRMADPTNFLRRYKRYKDGAGKAIDFTRNFRSNESILNFNNYVFDVCMTEKSCDVDYKGEARFYTESKEINKNNVQIHLFTKKNADKPLATGLYDIRDLSEERKIDARCMEGYYIADQIHALVGHAKGKDDKLIEYSDIAILFRSRNPQTKKIIDALLEKGIPLNEGKFSNNQEGIEEPLMNYLRVLDNPYQDYALAGFMLSVFGGLSEEELSNIAKIKGDSLYDKILSQIEEGGPLADKLKIIFERVEENRIKSSTKNVYDLVAGIVADYSFDAYLHQRGINQYNYLQSFLANIATQKYESLSEFLREYKFDSKSINQSGGENCVKISTMHAFKGLEAEVVFIPYLDRTYNEKLTTKVLVDGNGYIGMQYYDNDKKEVYPTISQIALKKMIKEREAKEEMRLFYVAMTRAKSYMYLSGTLANKNIETFGQVHNYGTLKSYLKLVEEAIYEQPEKYPYLIHDDDSYMGATVPIEHISIDELEGDKKLIKSIDKAMNYKYPHQESTILSKKYSVSEIDSAFSDEAIQNVFSDDASLGTSYHKVLEYIDFQDTSLDTIKGKIQEMLDKNLISDDMSDKIDPMVIKNCLDSDLMRYASTHECLREQRFVEYISAKDVLNDAKTDDKVLVQGIIDLVILGEKNIVVDYKNVKHFNEFNLKQYKKQLEIYTGAVEKSLGVKVDISCLYALRTGEVLTIEEIEKRLKK